MVDRVQREKICTVHSTYITYTCVLDWSIQYVTPRKPYFLLLHDNEAMG